MYTINWQTLNNDFVIVGLYGKDKITNTYLIKDLDLTPSAEINVYYPKFGTYYKETLVKETGWTLHDLFMRLPEVRYNAYKNHPHANIDAMDDICNKGISVNGNNVYIQLS